MRGSDRAVYTGEAGEDVREMSISDDVSAYSGSVAMDARGKFDSTVGTGGRIGGVGR